MSHRSAPLSFEGRLRLVQRCQQRPISHVAAEMGISRACASKWVNRWRRHGEFGLHDRPSTPPQSGRDPAWVIDRIETWRREKKWSANRITHELAELDFRINRRTVTRNLTHGITHIHRIVTDNGACYRSNDFARIVGHRTRHQKTKPYTPRHNGKAKRYHPNPPADRPARGALSVVIARVRPSMPPQRREKRTAASSPNTTMIAALQIRETST